MALIDKASLLMVPSTYEAGKLYNVLPSGNRAPDNKGGAGYDQTRADFDFDRGTDHAATRIGSDGLIKKYRENKLLQSNQFDTTWDDSSVITLTSGQEDKDGGTTAWKLAKGAASSFLYQSITTSGVNTFSLYAKADTTNWIMLQVSGIASVRTFFDLSNGVLGSSLSNVINATIESVGNGWYRCSFTYNGNAGAVRVFPADGNNATSGTSGSIFIQSAQLETGLVATDVLTSGATTAKAGVLVDLPRINFDANGENGSLLLEPSRANLAQYSEYFEGWSHKPNTTATSNYTTSPEGVQNATRLQFTANGYLYNSNAPSQVSGATYTLSCYAKRNDSGTQSFGFFANGSGAVDDAMALTSEWKRFDYTYTASNVSQLGLAGLSGADVSVYGFQVEKDSSYPTSYIPNNGESGGVTRAADVCSVTGVSDVIGQTEGTIYAEVNVADIESFGTYSAVRIYDGTSNNEIAFIFYSNGRVQATAFTGGSLVVNINDGDYGLSSGVHKIAFAYKANDYAFYIDGSVVGTDASASVPATNQIDLFYNNVGSFNHKQAALFNERLTNAELATLTTL